jgi:hypothetical protein
VLEILQRPCDSSSRRLKSLPLAAVAWSLPTTSPEHHEPHGRADQPLASLWALHQYPSCDRLFASPTTRTHGRPQRLLFPLPPTGEEFPVVNVSAKDPQAADRFSYTAPITSGDPIIHRRMILAHQRRVKAVCHSMPGGPWAAEDIYLASAECWAKRVSRRSPKPRSWPSYGKAAPLLGPRPKVSCWVAETVQMGYCDSLWGKNSHPRAEHLRRNVW